MLVNVPGALDNACLLRLCPVALELFQSLSQHFRASTFDRIAITVAGPRIPINQNRKNYPLTLRVYMAITNSKNPLLLPNLSITTHPTTHISSYLQLPALSMYSGYSANQSLTNIPFIADGGSNHSARFPDLSSPPVTNQQQQQYGG
ncbi:hypothetical protein JR316_0012514 [Psilocybe cubensis]|uniref:Uncharacterized protein n=1 Tax=Psilocybe cubensis TaxID=181762 RepID=A0ACB8GIF6_PSICU|nr:hypothetical protein JR316_0012514 [Psilocybe cubensis]KAH9475403.1 hypothetical protein JR316_0012514 [Psilocybe cubensis]